MGESYGDTRYLGETKTKAKRASERERERERENEDGKQETMKTRERDDVRMVARSQKRAKDENEDESLFRGLQERCLRGCSCPANRRRRTRIVSNERALRRENESKTYRSRVSRVGSLISVFRRSGDVLVEVVLGCGSGSSRSLGQPARDSDLEDRVGDESGPVEFEEKRSAKVL